MRDKNGKRLFSLIRKAAETKRATETKQKESDRKQESCFSFLDEDQAELLCQISRRWSFHPSRPGERQVKLVPEPGTLPLTNKPHNGTLSGSKWEHSFSLPQVYLSPHALTPQCRGVLRYRITRGGGWVEWQDKQGALAHLSTSIFSVFPLLMLFSLPHVIFILITGRESIIPFFGSGRWYLC